MMQCEYVNPETSEPCQMPALTTIEAPGATMALCYNHSDDPDVVAKRKRTRRKGGLSKRKVVDAPELGALLEELQQGKGNDVLAVKKLVLAAMTALLDGRLTPTQFRALVGVGGRALHDLLELQLYQELLGRVARLEAGETPEQLQIKGVTWQPVEYPET